MNTIPDTISFGEIMKTLNFTISITILIFTHTYYMTNWYISVDRTNGSRWLYI